MTLYSEKMCTLHKVVLSIPQVSVLVVPYGVACVPTLSIRRVRLVPAPDFVWKELLIGPWMSMAIFDVLVLDSPLWTLQ